MVERIRDPGGAVLAGQTTASEFGGVNVTRTVIHGVTRNPWNTERTPGGSSGGTAAAVAGGLLTDRHGRRRWRFDPHPGRVHRAVRAEGDVRPDPARAADADRQHHRHDRLPQPLGARHGALVRRLQRLRRPRPVQPAAHRRLGARPRLAHRRRCAGCGSRSSPTGAARSCHRRCGRCSRRAAARLIAATGMVRVDGVDTSLPNMGAAWSISGGIGTYAQLAEHWPECKDVLTPEIRGIDAHHPGALRPRGAGEDRAAADGAQRADGGRSSPTVDLVITASNPDVAFAAEGPLPSVFGGITAGAGNNGRLTFPANLHGNPAVSVPAGTVDGLPVGLQIVGRHYTEQLLLDAALVMERAEPWPLVAPGQPRRAVANV